MFTKIICFLVLLLISGCDNNLLTQPQQIPQQHLKWAVVDKSNLKNYVTSYLRKNDPNYKNTDYQTAQRNRDLDRIHQQIHELKSSATKKCASDITKTDKNKSSSESPKATPLSAATPLGDIDFYDSIRTNPKLRTNPLYQECIRNSEKDPLISELKARKQKLEDENATWNQHNQEIYKQIDENIESTIANYAKNKGYQLIIDQSYKSMILYNGDKVVLDVTEDILQNLLTSIKPSSITSDNTKP